MNIALSESIKTSLKEDNCQAIEVVTFLLTKGFKSKKDPSFTSLGELTYDGARVSKVSIDQRGNAKITF
jgi:hypothetical protein